MFSLVNNYIYISGDGVEEGGGRSAEKAATFGRAPKIKRYQLSLGQRDFKHQSHGSGARGKLVLVTELKACIRYPANDLSYHISDKETIAERVHTCTPTARRGARGAHALGRSGFRHRGHRGTARNACPSAACARSP